MAEYQEYLESTNKNHSSPSRLQKPTILESTIKNHSSPSRLQKPTILESTNKNHSSPSRLQKPTMVFLWFFSFLYSEFSSLRPGLSIFKVPGMVLAKHWRCKEDWWHFCPEAAGRSGKTDTWRATCNIMWYVLHPLDCWWRMQGERREQGRARLPKHNRGAIISAQERGTLPRR